MEIIQDPWPHAIIENYFEPNMFREMKSELVKYTKANIIKMNSRLKIEDFSNLPKTKICIQAANISEATLKYFSEHRSYTSLSLRPQVLICAGNYQHKIHDEADNKVLSAVTYIISNSGHGTRIYDIHKKFFKEVAWKENKTLIFAGITGKTWHDYYSDSNSIRITINFFLER